MEIKDYNDYGGYIPSSLKWDETIEFPSTRKLKEFGNRVYNRYPARSIFLVPRATISDFVSRKGKINVLDPFMGSGTSAVEASLKGCSIYGTEMDKFARLVAEVSILRFSEEEIETVFEVFNQIQHGWKEFEIDNSLYPILFNIEYWFDKEIFEDLLRLKSFIYNKVSDEKLLKFFKIAFADCIKPCSKMERQSTKPYISAKYKKTTKSVNESFQYSFSAHLEAIKQYNLSTDLATSEINWLGFDATNFTSQGDFIDLAITSPPYLNAFDYTQIIKVESAWVGTLINSDLSELRGRQVGHEKRRENLINQQVFEIFQPYYDLIISEFDKQIKIKSRKDYENIAKTCMSYFNDMFQNLASVKDALKRSGQYHMVIGDNVVKGVEIPTHRIIASLAQTLGFNWVGYYKYEIKDHRTSIPRETNGGKIKYEFVIILEKQ